MSRARLVITAVVVEGRGVREVARTYDVSPGWASKLVARYRSEGEAAFEPNHPTTYGEVERFHQTLKRWLAVQTQPATIEELQALLDTFVDHYNHQRPHRSLPGQAPPAVVYVGHRARHPAGGGRYCTQNSLPSGSRMLVRWCNPGPAGSMVATLVAPIAGRRSTSA